MTDAPEDIPDSDPSAPTRISMIEAIRRGELPQPPVADLVGFRLTEAERGRTVVRLDAGPRHHNPMGTLHGGILCDAADFAMGCAWASTLGEGESFTTIELKINYLRPVWEGAVFAEARVVKEGRTLGLVHCDLRDEAGKAVAWASSTCMTLRGDAASGR